MLNNRNRKRKSRKRLSLVLVFTVLFLLTGPVLPIKFVFAQTPAWNASASKQVGDAIELHWNAISGASGYKIYRTTDQPGEFTKLIATIPDGTTTIFTDASVTEKVLYHYEIASITNGVESVLSKAFTIRPDQANPQPAAISSAAHGANWVDIQWNQPGGPLVHHYEIFRNNQPAGILNAEASQSTLTYRDLGIKPGTEYSYYVVSVGTDGKKSTASNSISVTANGDMSNMKLNEDFAGAEEWTANGASWLSFDGKAVWQRTGSGLSGETANADLLDNHAFGITASEAGKQATLSFDWNKSWANASSPTGAFQQELRVYYKKVGDANWTEAWQELQAYQNKAKTESIGVTFPTEGQYILRFAGTLAISDAANDTVTMQVDNVKLSYPNQALAAPANPRVTAADGRATVTWSANTEPNVVGYKIVRSTSGNFDSNYSLYATTSMTSFTDPSLPGGKTIYYKIVAVDSSGAESARSTAVSFENPPVPAADLAEPEPASGLRATSATAGKIELNWTPSTASDVIQYIIWKSDDGLAYTNAAVTTGGSYSVNSGISGQKKYWFRVMAKDAAGNYSEGSNILKVETPPGDTEKPTVPGNFRKDGDNAIGETFVQFRWDTSRDNQKVDHYEIQMQKGSVYETVETVYHPKDNGLVENLRPSTDYTFRLIAVDTSNNQSDPSPVVSIKTLADNTPPKLLIQQPYPAATDVYRKTLITVRFDDAIDPATVNGSSFSVVKVADSARVAGTVGVSSSMPNEISFSHAGLEPKTEYKVTLTTTIKNFSGQPLDKEYTWTFTTGDSNYLKPHGNYTENTSLCSTCHSTHTAQGGKLINQQEVAEACYTCHDGTGSDGNGSVFNTGAEIKHASVTSSHQSNGTGEEGVQNTCTSCHNPHDSGIDLDTGLHKTPLPRLLTSTDKGDPTANPAVKPTLNSSGKDFCWNCHGKTTAPDYSKGYLDDIDKNGVSTVKYPTININGALLTSTEYRGDHQTYFPSGDKGHNSSLMDGYKWFNADTGERAKTGTDLKCDACHEKHASSVKPLLRTRISWGTDPLPPAISVNGKEFCYQCHSQKLSDVTHNDTATDPKELEWNGQSVNEASGHAQFDCQVCHNPHGSPNANNLRLQYKSVTSNWQTYTYRAEDFTLCFDCHDETKVRGNTIHWHLTDKTVTDTVPVLDSNGQPVIDETTGKPKTQQVTRTLTPQAACKDCHRPHGAIADENSDKSAFGLSHKIGFPGPVQLTGRMYTRTSDGGSCGLNCHNGNHAPTTEQPAKYSYTGALRGSTENNWSLKPNWQTESWLLNNRPAAYKNGNGTHYRDANHDGYLWK